MTLVCSICGGTGFCEAKVLWPDLIEAWQLDRAEADYIDRQQGCACAACGTNLRGVALGDAIRQAIGTTLPLREAVEGGLFDEWAILDVNGAPGVSSTMASISGYIRGDYPGLDLHDMPYEDAGFDLIFHSDTLEHVANPVRALEECRRILRPGRRLCFTAPIIVARMSRSRAGLPSSWHGNTETAEGDLLVRNEFGADLWTKVLSAGFTDVALNQVDYPSGIAISAWNTAPAVRFKSKPIDVVDQLSPELHVAAPDRGPYD